MIFDIGGVLVTHDNALLFQRLAERCHSPHASPRAIHDAVLNSGLRTGEQSVPEFYSALVRNFDFGGDYGAFSELWVSHFDPIPQNIALVRRLHGDYHLFLLSDINGEHWQHVSKNYLEPQLFEGIFLSYQLGMVKPDPKLFEHVLEMIGCPPSNCVFIDDTPVNVQAARAFGINAFVYRSTFDLFAGLSGIDRARSVFRQ